MGKYQIRLEKLAVSQLKEHAKSGNKATIKKIDTLFLELSENPFTGTGQPEMLKHELAGFWSRRINLKDRLVYKVEENIVTVFVLSVKGHYLDN